jgi:hypothetical protein
VLVTSCSMTYYWYYVVHVCPNILQIQTYCINTNFVPQTQTLKKREKESSMNLFKEQEKVKSLDAKIIALDADKTRFEQL